MIGEKKNTILLTQDHSINLHMLLLDHPIVYLTELAQFLC